MGERLGSLGEVRPSKTAVTRMDEEIARQLEKSMPVDLGTSTTGAKKRRVKINPYGELLEEPDKRE